MTFHRDDGSSERADLGPRLPYHDLAHYIIERRFGIKEGFFGHIARGQSVSDMLSTEAIRQMGSEGLKAEILTRSLQALHGGACTLEGFIELANAEFSQWGIPQLAKLEAQRLPQILDEYRALLARYDALKPNESLQLEFV